jgi:hypothetical protein
MDDREGERVGVRGWVMTSQKLILLYICIGGIVVCASLDWQDGVYLCIGGSWAALIGVCDD